MKLLLAAVLFVSLSFLSSCKKIADFEAPCKILTITEKTQYLPTGTILTNTLRFYYNSKGDPIRLDFDRNETGKPDYFFTYDNKGRLTELVTKYESAVEFTHHYYYNSKHFVSYDTTFYGRPTSYLIYVINKYSYDDKGRISRVDHKASSGPEFVSRFEYNDAGNRTLAFNNTPLDGSTYDNKVNFLRTNLIFAFLQRDYSMNNRRAATSYNAKNLPLAFPNYAFTDPNSQPIIGFLNMQVYEITYSCENK